jgi:TonB family protein
MNPHPLVSRRVVSIIRFAYIFLTILLLAIAQNVEATKPSGPISGSFQLVRPAAVSGANKCLLQLVPNADVGTVTIRVEAIYKLQYSGPMVWEHQFAGREPYSTELEVSIPPHDTSGIVLEIICLGDNREIPLSFVATADTVKAWNVYPRDSLFWEGAKSPAERDSVDIVQWERQKEYTRTHPDTTPPHGSEELDRAESVRDSLDRFRKPEETSPDTAALPSPDEFVPLDTYPEMTYMEPVKYPSYDTQSNHEGTVFVKVLISVTGKVLKAMAAKTCGNQRLDQAAIDSAYKTLFKPGYYKGRAVACWAMYKVDFKVR